jgi:hypothetical protein
MYSLKKINGLSHNTLVMRVSAALTDGSVTKKLKVS